MMIRPSILLFCAFLLAPITPALSQSNENTQETETVDTQEVIEPREATDVTERDGLTVIMFSVDIAPSSIEQLMMEVNREVEAGAQDFLLLINSYGGDLVSSLAAYNYLSSLPIRLRTHNMAETSSAANILYCAGDTRTASPNSLFVIHNGNSGLSGTTINALETYYQATLSRVQFSRDIFSACTGNSLSETERIFFNEAVLTAQDAERLGLVHEVRELNSEMENVDKTIFISAPPKN